MRLLFAITAAFSLLLTSCGGNDMRSLSPSSGHEEAAAAAPAEGEHGAAAEGGEHGEKKPKPDEKPRPDSVISSVLSLPVVKKWGEFMESKDNGSKIVAWGEYIKKVKGSNCWSIVVAEENSKGATTVWKRFCMQQTGLEMWVETTLGAKSEYETNYLSYDNWRTQCEPSYNSPGKC